MADTKSTDKAAAPVEKMYRNKSRMTQIIYPNGLGDKRIVPVGHTVMLTDEQFARFFTYFEPVVIADAK